MIIFNLAAVPQIAIALGGGGLLWAILEGAGVDPALALGLAMLVAGVFIVWRDLQKERRCNAPASAFWRLFAASAGGHIFFIPCWIIGGASVAVGWFFILDSFVGVEAHQWALFFGLLGFAYPVGSETLLVLGLPRSRHQPHFAETNGEGEVIGQQEHEAGG